MAPAPGGAGAAGLVKPPAFDYHAPRSVDEAVALLARYGDDAKVIAGGQSLMPLLNMRLSRPAALVDVNRIESLERIRHRDGVVEVGALVRQRTLEHDERLRAALPLLAAMAPHIGHPATRNRGTIVGSLAHADPSAELPCATQALEASFMAVGPRGSRKIAAGAFYRGLLTTDLGPGEIVTGVEIPLPAPGTVHAFLEMARRFGDFAIVAVAVLLAVDDRGRVRDLRIALAGVAPTPVRATRVERALAGAVPTANDVAEAAHLVDADIDPYGDLHATADYRRAMARVFVRRALTQAWQQAQPAEGPR